jgi:hypothetical protein
MPSEPRKPERLFVSHISDEAGVAELLRKQIEEDFIGQVDLFTSSDISSIAAGEEWLSAIQNALRDSAAVLVLCSANSVTRPWVQFELGAAWMKQMRIIPICHSGMEPDDLPMPLTRLQGVRLGTEAGVQRLYQAVGDLLGWPKVPQPKDLQKFLDAVNAVETPRDHIQQFERYIDIILPKPGTLEGDTIPESAKIESNADSLEIFGFTGTTRRTWGDICKQARKIPDTRWLTQLQHCVRKAGRDEIFRPVQAIYHAEGASYQPQLAKKEAMPDGSCRYHVHFVETTVAPLTEVQNDFGLLATLLRLGLRFRYEVVEHFQRSLNAAKAKPKPQQPAELERILTLLRGAIELIEHDALSRGAENFDPDAVTALFEDECEQREMAEIQALWPDTRTLLFRTEPPLKAADVELGVARLREANFRFMRLATKRYHEMVSSRWGVQMRGSIAA